MATTDRAAASGGSAGTAEDDAPQICAYSTSKERTVFTESGNDDGWIATDLTVDPEQ